MRTKRWALLSAWGAAGISVTFAVVSVRAAARGHMLETDLTTVDTITGTANKIVTTLGILLGGAWAYYKFIRGRIFMPRASLEPSVFVDNTRSSQIVVGIKFVNVGSVQLKLDEKMKYLRIFGLVHSTSGLTDDWELLAMRRIFEDQETMEPGEPIEEHLLCSPPTDNEAGVPFVAYKVVALVGINYKGNTIGYSAPRIHVLPQKQHVARESSHE